MVKLNLTGLQSSDSNETPLGEQTPETIEVAPSTEEAAATEQPNYSFSLSSLIGNTNPTSTTQETTNTTETTIQDTSTGTQETLSTETTIEQPKIESLLSIGGNTLNSTISANEEVISINSDSIDGTTEETIANDAGATPEVAAEPEENREFFKSFDVIREFSEEKGDEIVIGKGEAKIEPIPEETKQEELESIAIMTDTNESILEESKNAAEIAIAQVEEAMAPSMTIMQSAPVNLDINNDTSTQDTAGESIVGNVAEAVPVTAENNVATDIEQAKKDLSATRKPFGIKSFSKKSVIVSLGAVFVFGLATLGISQMGLINGKSNIQETPTVIKYVSGTDYTVIANKNKRKNIRKPREIMPTNSGAEIGTGKQLSDSGSVIDNSGSTTMSGTTTSSGTEMSSGVVNEQPASPSATMMPQPGQGPNQTPRELQGPQGPSNSNSGIPAVEPTNTPANDMNDIANGAN